MDLTIEDIIVGSLKETITETGLRGEKAQHGGRMEDKKIGGWQEKVEEHTGKWEERK